MALSVLPEPHMAMPVDYTDLRTPRLKEKSDEVQAVEKSGVLGAGGNFVFDCHSSKARLSEDDRSGVRIQSSLT